MTDHGTEEEEDTMREHRLYTQRPVEGSPYEFDQETWRMIREALLAREEMKERDKKNHVIPTSLHY